MQEVHINVFLCIFDEVTLKSMEQKMHYGVVIETLVTHIHN